MASEPVCLKGFIALIHRDLKGLKGIALGHAMLDRNLHKVRLGLLEVKMGNTAIKFCIRAEGGLMA